MKIFDIVHFSSRIKVLRHKGNQRFSNSEANFSNLETKTATRCSENKKCLRLKCGLVVAVNFYIWFDKDVIKFILILNEYYLESIDFFKYKISPFLKLLA